MKKRSERRPQTSSESGMSLVEVMVSMVVMGVVLVVLGQGLTLGIRMNSESKTKISNLAVCKQATENLKSQIQASQPAFDGATNNSSPFYAAFNRSSSNPLYFDDQGNQIPDEGDKSGASFQVIVGVSDWTDSAGNTLTNSAGNVLLKTLTVKVISSPGAIVSTSSNTAGSARETAIRVEIVRPAA